jgi:hypothetical protein
MSVGVWVRAEYSLASQAVHHATVPALVLDSGVVPRAAGGLPICTCGHCGFCLA